MKQVLFGRAGSPSGTQYATLMGFGPLWSTEVVGRSPWAAPGVLRNLVVEVATAPGVGTSRTFTLRLNGAGTALTVTISNTATTARLTGVDVTVAVSDLLALQASVSGSPAATATVRWSLEFEGSTAQESAYTQAVGPAGSAAGNRVAGVFDWFNTFTSATTATTSNVVAAAGTLTRLMVLVGTSLTASNGYTVYVNRNGVRQDGSGGTVNTACAILSGTSASATFSLPLVPGDVVYLECVLTGTFTSRQWAFATAFVATTDGQSQVCGGWTSTLSTSAAQYPAVPAIGNGPAATETDFANRASGGVTPCVLSGLQVLLGTAPGASTSRLVDLRVNGAAVGPTVTISGSATTGSDLANTGTIVDGDLWNLQTVPTATPAASLVHWGFIQSPVSAVVARSTPFVGPLIVSG